MKTIFLIRHGETDGNAAGLAQGHYDEPLNKEGRAQAELLAQRLLNWRIDAIYSSDSTRTVQTAEPLLRMRPELTIETTSDLREKFYGDCENATWDALRTEHQETFERMLNPAVGSDVRFPGGETDREHMHRVARFIDEIPNRHDEGSNILVFSHGGSIKAAGAHLCRLRIQDKWRLKTDNTGISSVIDDPTWSDDAWQIERWNDTNHLNGFRSPV